MQTIRFLLLFEAAIFAAAALIHFGAIAAGYENDKAGVAESVIATVLFAGAILTWFGPSWTRGVGIAAQAFALNWCAHRTLHHCRRCRSTHGSRYRLPPGDRGRTDLGSDCCRRVAFQ